MFLALFCTEFNAISIPSLPAGLTDSAFSQIFFLTYIFKWLFNVLSIIWIFKGNCLGLILSFVVYNYLRQSDNFQQTLPRQKETFILLTIIKTVLSFQKKYIFLFKTDDFVLIENNMWLKLTIKVEWKFCTIKMWLNLTIKNWMGILQNLENKMCSILWNKRFPSSLPCLRVIAAANWCL